MKRIVFFLVLLCLEKGLHAQYVYTIKADSVKITNTCDTAELIVENHTQTVPGFLFNKGRGRTEFRKIIALNDSTLLFGTEPVIIRGMAAAGNGLHMAAREVQLGGPLTNAVTTITGNNNKMVVFDSLSIMAINSDTKISRLAVNIDPASLGQAVFGAKANFSNGAFFRFYNSFGGSRFALDMVNDEGRFIMSDNNGIDKIRLQSNNVSFFNGGNVAIGATITNAKLTVVGDAGGNQNLISLQPSDNPVSANKILFSRLSDNWTPVAIGQLYNIPANYGGNLVFYTHSNNGIVGDQSSPVERMRIDPSGNVGIGAFPMDKLHIEGTARITDTLKLINLIIKSDTNAYKPMVSDANGNTFKMAGWPATTTPALTIVNGNTSDVTAAVGTLTKLPNLAGAGSHSVTLPAAASYAGKTIYLWNMNGSSNSWTFSSSVTLPDGTTSNTIPNQSTIELLSDGAVWIKWK